jgi:hypothetical protein
MSRRTLKRLAVGYAVKTLILFIACLAYPDLPQRVLQAAHATWRQVAGQD